MPREIEYWNGTSWTPRGEHRALLGIDGTRWTTTKVAPTRNAPFAGLRAVTKPELPAGKVEGVRWEVMLFGVKVPTTAEITMLMLPYLEKQGFEAASKPQLVVDPNVVWTMTQEKESTGGWIYEATVGAGPFKGYPGLLELAYTPPPITALTSGISVIARWSVDLRPATLEKAIDIRGRALQGFREQKGADALRVALSRTVGSDYGPYTDGTGPNDWAPEVKAPIVPVAAKSGGGAVAFSAAIIGIALTMLSLRERG